jgi:hypothetical protein
MKAEDKYVQALSRRSFFTMIPMSVLWASVIILAVAMRGHIDVYDGLLMLVLGSLSRINGWLNGVKDSSNAIAEALKPENK